jgi:hypothetical protein
LGILFIPWNTKIRYKIMIFSLQAHILKFVNGTSKRIADINKRFCFYFQSESFLLSLIYKYFICNFEKKSTCTKEIKRLSRKPKHLPIANGLIFIFFE